MGSILLISAPGAGKGVTAKYLNQKYNLVHMSIGNLIREKALKDENIKYIIKDGNFIDNDIVYNLLENFLEENKNKDFVFEGFPRTIEQIKPFEKIIQKYNINLYKVIFIDIDKNIALNRIKGRLICRNCNEIYNKFDENFKGNICIKCGNTLSVRDDDKENTYYNRYKNFEEKTIPAIEYYKKNKNFYKVSNNSSIIDMYSAIDYIMKGDNNSDNN